MNIALPGFILAENKGKYFIKNEDAKDSMGWHVD